MQKVAAYLLEKHEDMGDPEIRAAISSRCVDLLTAWIREKGGVDRDRYSGHYRAEDGGRGTYRWENAEDEERSWKCLNLDEIAPDGRRHGVFVSVTNTEKGIAIYVTIEAGTAGSSIAPVDIDPKCPRVVRTLIEQFGRWHHGPSELHAKALRRYGSEEGERLAEQIRADGRAVPYLVISTDPDGPVLPGLDSKLAYDLVGLANIQVIDSSAAWTLTKEFGKRHSCFSGAVRIYWPRFSIDDDPYHHPLWLAKHLQSPDGDIGRQIELFRRQLRMEFMRASALCVRRPEEIDLIQASARNRQLEALANRANSGANYEELANEYAKDNDSLRNELEKLSAVHRNLLNELEVLRTRVSNAELIALHRPQYVASIAPSSPDDDQDGPKPGDVRYYKKVDSTPYRDKMVIFGGCNHNNWESAHKADKASKGIEHLEGRKDWNSIKHCASCTGGGVWRVQW